MPEIISRMVIEATPAEIWRVVTNVNAYADWNPMAASGSGVPQPGDTFRLWLRLGPGNPKAVTCQIYDWQPERLFCWGNGLAPLLTVKHYVQLQDQGDGTTEIIHGEHFLGLLGWPVRVLGVRQANYDAFNRALAERVTALR